MDGLIMVLILDGNLVIGAYKEKSLLFDLCKAFEKIKSSHKFSENTQFAHACVTYYKIPSDIVPCI